MALLRKSWRSPPCRQLPRGAGVENPAQPEGCATLSCRHQWHSLQAVRCFSFRSLQEGLFHPRFAPQEAYMRPAQVYSDVEIPMCRHFWFCLFLPALVSAPAAGAVHVWEKQELTFTSARAFANPYTDVIVWRIHSNRSRPGRQDRLFCRRSLDGGRKAEKSAAPRLLPRDAEASRSRAGGWHALLCHWRQLVLGGHKPVSMVRRRPGTSLGPRRGIQGLRPLPQGAGIQLGIPNTSDTWTGRLIT